MYFYKARGVFEHASKIDRPFIHIEHNGNGGMAGHFSSFVGPSDMPGLARVAADIKKELLSRIDVHILNIS